MNQDKDKNSYQHDYVTTIKAIQDALINDSVDGYTRVYVREDNGLWPMDYLRLKDIFLALQSGHYIDINHLPITTELLADNKTKFHEPELQAYLEEIGKLKFFPRPIWPMNYFSITVEDKFKELAQSLGSPLHLQEVIPNKDRRTKPHKKLLHLLLKHEKVLYYKAAKIFDSKATQSYYKHHKSQLDKEINNCKRKLSEYLKPHGYTVSEKDGYLFLVRIEPENT